MRLFYKNHGAISVFLCLILLPVLLFGGMTADAARIYMAKVVISDSGEMAMNAGLAQYNEELHDEYGLFVMDESPEAMSGQLEGFFNASLNGTGLPDTKDYNKLLDLLTKNFEAINVAGSEIYRTEVEKQQILEYMKYRAPICLTEVVLEKLNELKDTQKMTEAMEAEMDFSLSMEECQDSFEEAKTALDLLEQAIQQYVSLGDVGTALNNAYNAYTVDLSRALLMWAAVQDYEERSGSTDLKTMAESYIASAQQVDMNAVTSSVSFNSYVDSLYYKNTVNDLVGSEGIDKLLNDYDKAQEETEASSETGTPAETGAAQENDQEREELEKIVSDYKNQERRISGYEDALWNTASNIINNHYSILHRFVTSAEAVAPLASDAYDKLEIVEDKLEDAADKFENWDDKTQALVNLGKGGSMEEETNRYRDFFMSGEGKSNLEYLEDLMEKVQQNQTYFEDSGSGLEGEKFWDQSIAIEEPSSQLSEYSRKAENTVAGYTPEYTSLENARAVYIKNYEHLTMAVNTAASSIGDDPFYQRLIEYCEEKSQEDSQEEQNAANENLNGSKDGAAEAGTIDGYPDFDWSSAGVTLPSSVTSTSASSANDSSLDITGDVDDSGARKEAVSEFKSSISEANSFLDRVDEIVTGGLENLYIAEYAMQMFSYYTVDKEDGKSLPAEDVISISGYQLSDHPAYGAECEYILWGDSSSQNNVRNTVMLIFGIRMLFNSFFAFTNGVINLRAQTAASAIAGAAPYLIPIVSVVIKLGFAGIETANDVRLLKQGYGVAIIKDERTWCTGSLFPNVNSSAAKLAFDYSDYLRVFLNISILTGHESGVLGRIADCIQVNQPGVDLLNSYTMVAVQADVKCRTTFMRKISDWGASGAWGFPGDYYTIDYESILGY